MEAISYKEWRDQNLDSSFPFVYNNSEIDNGIFIDASISVYGSTLVWLSSLSIKNNIINGELLTDKSVKFTFSSLGAANSYMLLNVYNNEDKIIGNIMLGDYFYETNKNKKSFYKKFIDKSLLINPTCLISHSFNQVSSIKFNSGKPIKGFISLHEGPGVEINGSINKLIIDSVGKDNSVTLDECCDPNQVILKKINGISPSEINLYIKQRDIGQPSNTLDKRQVIRVNQVQNGVKIELSK
jgi:hypothetical protein